MHLNHILFNARRVFFISRNKQLCNLGTGAIMILKIYHDRASLRCMDSMLWVNIVNVILVPSGN